MPGTEEASSDWCSSSGNLDVAYRRLPGILSSLGGSADLFRALYPANAAEDTFWLDSATMDRGRFSFMGGQGGPLWRRVTYQLPSLKSCSHQGGPSSGANGVDKGVGLRTGMGHLRSVDAAGRETVLQTGFLDWLQCEYRALCSCAPSNGCPDFPSWSITEPVIVFE